MLTSYMKDSGVEWIKQIPRSWEMKKVKSFLVEKSEKNYPDEEVLSLYRDYGVIPKSSRDDNHNVTSLNKGAYKLVLKDNVVINKMKAWQGSLAVSRYQGIISPAYYIFEIKNKNEILPEFLHYVLRNPVYIQEYRRISAGLRIGQWDLNKTEFNSLYYPIPPVEIQYKIVSFLDKKIASIDDLVQSNQQSIRELKYYKQSIISEAVTRGISPKAEMKKSGINWIGNIPKQWEIRKMKFVTKTNETKKEFSKGDLYIGLENVTSFDGVLNSNGELAEDSKENFFEKNSILYSKLRPYLAKGFIADTSGSCSGEFIVFKEFNGNKRYLLYWLISQIFTDFINATSYGAKMPRSSWDHIKETPIPRPPALEENEIVSYLDIQSSRIDKLIKDKLDVIEELASYKRSMIYEYMSGIKEV